MSVIACVVCILPIVANPSGNSERLEIRRQFSPLVRASNAIVIGKVVGQESSWNEDRTRIYTRVTYAIERSVTNTSPTEILVVRTLGGTVGRITQTLLGAPAFHVGQRDLLFLRASAAPGLFELAGTTIGKYAITEDAKSNQPMVNWTPGYGETLKGKPRLQGAPPSPARIRVDDAIHLIQREWNSIGSQSKEGDR